MPRLKPSHLSPDAVHNPHFTVDEVYRTLVFYRDCPVSAHKIAVKRDAARFMKQFGRQGPPGCVPVYVGPGGIRTAAQIENDTDQCAKCGKEQYLVGRLKKCTVCQKTYYCSRECQKSDWKRHKKICRTL